MTKSWKWQKSEKRKQLPITEFDIGSKDAPKKQECGESDNKISDKNVREPDIGKMLGMPTRSGEYFTFL